MKLYFAGADASIEFFYKLGVQNLLIAYPFLQKKQVNPNKKFFIDSGAYSVMTSGIEIDLNNYIKFLLENDYKIYAGLDVIGDAEQTKQNNQKMVEAGLNPIPTFHYGEPISYLEHYLENYDYIAIGGLVPLKSSTTNLFRFLDYCFTKIVTKKSIAKVHGFGIVNWQAMKRYPFYSVDATSWQNPTRWGQHFQFSKGRLNRISSQNARQFKHKTSNEQLADSVKTFLEVEKYITKLWEKRGVVWED
jgi:hypothetical protein